MKPLLMRIEPFYSRSPGVQVMNIQGFRVEKSDVKLPLMKSIRDSGAVAVIDRLRIFEVRGEAVVLHSDLAAIYGVTTGNFNKAVKRNFARFPEDFTFVLTKKEFESLIFQIGTSKGRGGRRKLPRVFTVPRGNFRGRRRLRYSSAS